jgi:3alpha(or 20beta)-hydroxysteroid dehydrogenase
VQRFEDKTVIITGPADEMGATHARGFAAEGAKVVLADVTEGEGRWLSRELGDRALLVPLDVTQEEQWDAAVREAEETFGPVTVLVNDARTSGLGTIRDSDAASWRGTIDVNLVGPYLGIRSVAPSMRTAGGGSVVNISTTAGFTAAPGASAYTASSWGLRGLTRAAALELGRDDIRVNSIHLRPVDAREADELAARPPLSTVAPESGYAISRAAHPEEVTRLILFLASSDASFSTGSEFLVDGGQLLGPALPREPGAAVAP